VINQGVNRLIPEIQKILDQATGARLRANQAIGMARAVKGTSMQERCDAAAQEATFLADAKAEEFHSGVRLLADYMMRVFEQVESW